MIKAGDFTEWVDSKPPFAVVYISFVSVVNLKQEQATEIAYWLMISDRSCGSLGHLMKKFPRSHLFYLMLFWVKVGDKGKVVQWSQQQWVLAHPSVACFMPHCRWNSVLEVLANGCRCWHFLNGAIKSPTPNAWWMNSKLGFRWAGVRLGAELFSQGRIIICLLEVISDPKAADVREN